VNSAGQSPTSTVTLTVTASKSTGGGSGAVDEILLIGAGALVARRVLARSGRPRP
jgi:hypothetical protein